MGIKIVGMDPIGAYSEQRRGPSIEATTDAKKSVSLEYRVACDSEYGPARYSTTGVSLDIVQRGWATTAGYGNQHEERACPDERGRTEKSSGGRDIMV